MRYLINKNGLSDKVSVASSATHGYRVGEASDSRCQRVANERGYDLSQIRSQKIGWQDFEDFDLILAMDKSNLYNLQRMATEEQRGRIKLLMTYALNYTGEEVPDPYLTLGGSFEHVLDLIEDAAYGVIEQIKKQLDAGSISSFGESMAE